MLTYVVTVAISRVLRPALPRRRCSGTSSALAGRHHRRRDHHRRPRRDQHRRRQGVDRRQHRCWRSSTSSRRCCWCSIGVVPGASTPRSAGRQRHARRRADVEELHPRDPDRHDRLHGHRDDLEHGRGGQGRDHDDPGGDRARARSPCSPSTSRCPPSRSSRCRSAARRRRVPDAARPAGGAGRLAGDPVAGRGARNLDLGVAAAARRRSTSASWPPRSCSWPPTPA